MLQQFRMDGLYWVVRSLKQGLRVFPRYQSGKRQNAMSAMVSQWSQWFMMRPDALIAFIAQPLRPLRSAFLRKSY